MSLSCILHGITKFFVDLFTELALAIFIQTREEVVHEITVILFCDLSLQKVPTLCRCIWKLYDLANAHMSLQLVYYLCHVTQTNFDSSINVVVSITVTVNAVRISNSCIFDVLHLPVLGAISSV